MSKIQACTTIWCYRGMCMCISGWLSLSILCMSRIIKALKTHSITLTALTAPFSSASIPLALVEWENMLSVHSSNQYQYPKRYSKQLLPWALISCQQMGFLATCQKFYITTNLTRKTEQCCVFITQVLHTDKVSLAYKAVHKNREKNVRNLTWLKISAQSVLNLT